MTKYTDRKTLFLGWIAIIDEELALADCAGDFNKTITLASLTQDGRNLLSMDDPVFAHRDFELWLNNVAKWLDGRFPESGYSAQWSSLPISLLVLGNTYDPTDQALVRFQQMISARLKWIGNIGEKLSKKADIADSDTQESDLIFADILHLVDTSLLSQHFKTIVQYDIAEAQKAYHAAVYKGCVVMLGAALEGIMLGTLQRPDVLMHFKVASSVPKPIRSIGNRDPALPERIGNELSFEDYKVCIHALIPGSNALGVDNIQDFRNAIHPWKSIQEPIKYGAFDRSRALHYVASLHKIVQALREWAPESLQNKSLDVRGNEPTNSNGITKS